VFDKVVELYIESAADLLTRMQAASQAGDLKIVEDAAHTLKTSAANVGARTLSSMCKQIEVQCRSSDGESVGPAIRNLQLEHEKVCRALLAERTSNAA
jgi:HPt (histidine-containing phosphotransfer) domain-containing protein